MTRKVLPACVALASALAAVLLGVLAKPSMPDSVATHFGFDGVANSWVPVNVFWWIVMTCSVTAAGLAFFSAWRLSTKASRSMWLWLWTFFAALPTGIAVWTVVTQSGLTSTQDAHGPSVVAITLIVGVPLVVAALVAARSGGVLPDPHPGAGAGLGLGPHEIASWSHEVRVWWPWLLVVAALAGAAVAGVLGYWVPAALLVCLSFVGITTSGLRVSVDARGLITSWGPLGWPQLHVPLSELASARAELIRPRDWGGWGYRGSLRMFGKAASVLRGGDGIVVQRTDGSVYAVTIDDAHTGAALLNDLIARTHAQAN